MDDHEAYRLYSSDTKWYNKLYVAQMCGYRVGRGVIPSTGTYIIRPMINLDGGGVGATIRQCYQGERIDDTLFWSEVFTGRHITIDYTYVGCVWVQGHTFEGFNQPHDLIHFSHWKRVDYPFALPSFLTNDLHYTDQLNIEIIGDRLIEVHLRHNLDPVEHDVFYPIWTPDQSPPQGNWTRIPDTQQHVDRLGFYVPQKD